MKGLDKYLADAMAKEFPFLGAKDDTWLTSARSVLNKIHIAFQEDKIKLGGRYVDYTVEDIELLDLELRAAGWDHTRHSRGDFVAMELRELRDRRGQADAGN